MRCGSNFQRNVYHTCIRIRKKERKKEQRWSGEVRASWCLVAWGGVPVTLRLGLGATVRPPSLQMAPCPLALYCCCDICQNNQVAFVSALHSALEAPTNCLHLTRRRYVVTKLKPTKPTILLSLLLSEHLLQVHPRDVSVIWRDVTFGRHIMTLNITQDDIKLWGNSDKHVRHERTELSIKDQIFRRILGTNVQRWPLARTLSPPHT